MERLRRLAPALGVKQFRLLWGGQTVSQIGDGIFNVALVLEVLGISHSPRDLAYVMVARFVPMLILILAGGAVVDRRSKRLVMLTSDTVRGLTVGLIALTVATHHTNISQLIIMSAIFGTADAFFQPAANAVIPDLVSEDLMASASALSQSSNQFAMNLIGPAIGGVVVGAIGTGASFGFDAGSYLVSILCLGVMQSTPVQPSNSEPMLVQIREGLAYCRTQKWMWRTLWPAGLANFAYMAAFTVVIPVLLRHTLHASDLSFGFVMAAGGMGGTLGALVLPHVASRKRPITTMWLTWAGAGVCIALMSIAPNVEIVGLLMVGALATMIGGNVIWFPLMQRLIEPEMLGRACSIDLMISFLFMPFGALAGGFADTALGTRHALVASGLLAVSMLATVLVPGVRDPERGGLDLFGSVTDQAAGGPEEPADHRGTVRA